MDKEKLQESIKNIEDGIKQGKENRDKADYHVAEGEIILKALKKELSLL